jgi:hypothetical protein
LSLRHGIRDWFRHVQTLSIKWCKCCLPAKINRAVW